MPNNINSGSYATYDDFDQFSYNCIKYLIENDEEIWKLLYYNSPDAWDKSNITRDKKISLIYKGEDDTSKFKVFMDMGQPDVLTKETCQIRIHPYSLFPNNRVWGTVMMMFEVYSNYHINTLTNYRTRVDMITKRFIQVFNGIDIAGIGKLHLDSVGTVGTKIETGGQLPFRGKFILMGNKSS